MAIKTFEYVKVNSTDALLAEIFPVCVSQCTTSSESQEINCGNWLTPGHWQELSKLLHTLGKEFVNGVHEPSLDVAMLKGETLKLFYTFEDNLQCSCHRITSTLHTLITEVKSALYESHIHDLCQLKLLETKLVVCVSPLKETEAKTGLHSDYDAYKSTSRLKEYCEKINSDYLGDSSKNVSGHYENITCTSVDAEESSNGVLKKIPNDHLFHDDLSSSDTEKVKDCATSDNGPQLEEKSRCGSRSVQCHDDSTSDSGETSSSSDDEFYDTDTEPLEAINIVPISKAKSAGSGLSSSNIEKPDDSEFGAVPHTKDFIKHNNEILDKYERQSTPISVSSDKSTGADDVEGRCTASSGFVDTLTFAEQDEYTCSDITKLPISAAAGLGKNNLVENNFVADDSLDLKDKSNVTDSTVSLCDIPENTGMEESLTTSIFPVVSPYISHDSTNSTLQSSYDDNSASKSFSSNIQCSDVVTSLDNNLKNSDIIEQHEANLSAKLSGNIKESFINDYVPTQIELLQGQPNTVDESYDPLETDLTEAPSYVPTPLSELQRIKSSIYNKESIGKTEQVQEEPKEILSEEQHEKEKSMTLQETTAFGCSEEERAQRRSQRVSTAKKKSSDFCYLYEDSCGLSYKNNSYTSMIKPSRRYRHSRKVIRNAMLINRSHSDVNDNLPSQKDDNEKNSEFHLNDSNNSPNTQSAAALPFSDCTKTNFSSKVNNNKVIYLKKITLQKSYPAERSQLIVGKNKNSSSSKGKRSSMSGDVFHIKSTKVRKAVLHPAEYLTGADLVVKEFEELPNIEDDILPDIINCGKTDKEPTSRKNSNLRPNKRKCTLNEEISNKKTLLSELSDSEDENDSEMSDVECVATTPEINDALESSHKTKSDVNTYKRPLLHSNHGDNISLPQHRRPDFVKSTVEKMRAIYDKNKILEWLPSQLPWFEAVLKGEIKNKMHETYMKGWFVSRNLPFPAYYGVLLRSQIEAIAEFLSIHLQKQLSDALDFDQRPNHTYTWQVQVPLVATLMCQEVTGLSFDSCTELIGCVRRCGVSTTH